MTLPVEPISLTIGAITLASLFSACIECFDYFKAGQALEIDFERLLVNFDVEKTRLLIWGNAVGILNPEGEGRVSELNNSHVGSLIERCLESIKFLLSDADDLQNVYGLRHLVDEENGPQHPAILSVNSMSVFKASYRRFWARFAGKLSRSTLAMRTRWSIYDKKKFEQLIGCLRGLINGLYQIVSMPKEVQNRTLKDDLHSILDISKLRLVQSACDGTYPMLSEAASSIISASECGSIDRRNVEEWLGDARGVMDEINVNADTSSKDHETSCKKAGISTKGNSSV